MDRDLAAQLADELYFGKPFTFATSADRERFDDLRDRLIAALNADRMVADKPTNFEYIAGEMLPPGHFGEMRDGKWVPKE